MSFSNWFDSLSPSMLCIPFLDEGGNDYPLVKVMNEMEDCSWYQAGEPSSEDGYKTTQKILESTEI